METVAQQIEAAHQAQVQANYDGAMAELERVFARGQEMVKAQYPPAGEGRGTAAQTEQLLSLAATIDAVLIGLTLPPRRHGWTV